MEKSETVGARTLDSSANVDEALNWGLECALEFVQFDFGAWKHVDLVAEGP